MNGTWNILDPQGVDECRDWVESHHPHYTPRPLWHPVSRYFWAVMSNDDEEQEIALQQMTMIGQPFDEDQHADWSYLQRWVARGEEDYR